MTQEILYMLGVVAVGFAVNYTLRALPFLLFAGRDRALPGWVLRFGDFISPVIIAALIVYSYSGLEWQTAWPYLAGALTVGLQLWKRNALASIVAGTVLYMVLLNCGCVTDNRIELSAAHPSIAVRDDGFYVGEERVTAEYVVDRLEDAGVPHDRTIHIEVDEGLRNLKMARYLMGALSCGGYRRSVLVTKRHAEAEKVDPAKGRGRKSYGSGWSKGTSGGSSSAKPKVRYRKSNE